MPQQDDRTSSRLVAKIREISRGASAPMGFGRAPTRKLPALLLIVRGGPSDVDLLRGTAPVADAMLIRMDGIEPDPTTAIKPLVEAANGLPLGVELSASLDATAVHSLAQAGVDFVAFEPQLAAADIFDISELGRIARLGPKHSSVTLRGLNEMPVDAIEVEIERPKDSVGRFTVHDLAEMRQLVDSARRPVLVVAMPGLRPADLDHFRELGAEALVVEAHDLGDTVDGVRETVTALREAIDKLGPPIGRGRTHEGRRVFLPSLRPTENVEEAGEDDDDDE